MIPRKAKGIGASGCCCGGCAQKPMDERNGRQDDNRILQSRCCRCIPNTICLSVTEYGYDSQKIIVHRECGPTTYNGNAIQYIATLLVSGVTRTLYVRMFVAYDECYIGWDIPEIGLSDDVLVDRTVPSTVCNLNMEPKKCSEFGGEWTVGDLTITIAEAATQNVKDLIECGGCSCICDCMCISIWSRTSDSLWSIAQSNGTVCAEVAETYSTGCGVTQFKRDATSLSWSLDGWNLLLSGQHNVPIGEADVVIGTGSLTGTCTLGDAVTLADSFNHTVDGAGAQVIYTGNMEDQIATGYKWLGFTYDETATLTIEAYDWVNAIWVVQETLTGRAVSETIPMVSVRSLTSEFTGTGTDVGLVKLRLTTTGSQIVTDMLLLTRVECCAMQLIPPDSIQSSSSISAIVIAGECPAPPLYWTFFDYDGTEWRVSAECRWCGEGTCGSAIVSCCPRPMPRYLFAEVQIDCPGCVGTAFTVPLDHGGTNSLWSGSTRLCGSTGNGFSLNVSCSSGAWITQVTLAPGACTLDGVTVAASSTSCDPLSITFNGTLKFGLGCCGPAGGFADTPAITITVIE